MSVSILTGDCRDMLTTLPDQSVHCCVTSPPYFGLRDYGVDGQMGLEPTPDEFVAGMVEVFRKVRRVLRDDGTLWLNIGDSYAGGARGGYPGGKCGLDGTVEGQNIARLAGTRRTRGQVPPAGLKSKDLIGIPWMLAFALRADGWYLRQDIIWAKPNPMPESVRDRCTKAHEYLFLLSKGPRYFYDQDAIREPVSQAMLNQVRDGYEGQSTKDYAAGRAQDASATKKRIIEGARKRLRGLPPRHAKCGASSDRSGLDEVGRGLGCNKRSVWTVATQPFKEAHFATFPPALIEDCIKAGCPAGGTVLDPFGGAGTTGLVADRLQRNAVLIELNPEYAAMAERRIDEDRGGLLSAMAFA